MRIIIIGAGKLGNYLASTLVHENHNVSVIDIDETVLEKLNNRLDVSVFVGNGLNVETLLEADIKNTDIAISCMKNDEDNILASLFAKNLGAKNTITRVRNPEYIKSIHYMKNNLGITMVINPELLTARKIESALKYSGGIKSSYLSRGKVELLEFKLRSDSPLINTSLKDVQNKLKVNILIVAVERNGKVIVPNGDFIFLEEDNIIVTAKHNEITQMLKEMRTNYLKCKNAMIIGGSKTAYYLAKNLTQDKIKVKIIENDLEKCQKLAEVLNDVLIIKGDGSDKNLLLEEGIENTDAFIASTGIDEENILLSLYAKTKTKGKIITKINRIAYEEVIGNLNLETIIYPKDITAEYILRFVRAKNNSIGSNIETMHFILDGG